MPKGIPTSGVNKGWFKKGGKSPMEGRKRPEMTGPKNLNWKGDKAGYSNKHHWAKRWLGSPTKCEVCGKDGLTGHKIHWASLSHKCLRIASDWMRMCVSCHKKYDLGKITITTK